MQIVKHRFRYTTLKPRRNCHMPMYVGISDEPGRVKLFSLCRDATIVNTTRHGIEHAGMLIRTYSMLIIGMLMMKLEMA